MTRRAVAILSVMLGAALLSGCTSRAERLYRRAETFLAQGQFEMAADEYRRIVSEEADAPLADDALYKLAYVLAEEMDKPTVGLVQYRALSDSYPDSPWVDDALMRIMVIQREALGDPSAVKDTCDELCRRFDERDDLCARGLLEVARAHFEAEQYPAATKMAESLIESYPKQRTQCAQAALLSARAAERRGAEQTEIERLYETVIRDYPDTHAASMAKRNIGWIFYGKREEMQQRQQQEIAAQSRIIDGVPPLVDRDARLPQALAALRAVLAHRGEQRSMEWIEALLGLPFTIVFDPDRPSARPRPVEGSPFEAVAEKLGFAHNTISGSDAESAFATVHQALLQGHPVLVRYGSQARWIVVTGYDRKEERVYFMPPGRNSYAAADRKRFLAGWRAGSGDGSGLVGPQPYHQFSLGARLSRPSDEDLLRGIAERAADVMPRRSIAGFPAGAAAWEAAGTWLEMCADPGQQQLQATAARWVEDGLRPYLARAATATVLLERAEGQMPRLQNAAQRHAELRNEAAVVARKITEAIAAEQDGQQKWRAAAAQANYVGALHQRLAEQLVGALNETVAWEPPQDTSG